MHKQMGILVLLGLMVLGLVGCSGGSYSIMSGGIQASKNGLSGSYSSFSGHYYKKVKLEDGKTMTVTLSAQTEKGELAGKVINSSGKTIETLKAGETVKVNTPDQYKLQVEGQKHKGGFILSWKIK
jgi:predicted RNA-binding protein YlqC (UPF0109 family)